MIAISTKINLGKNSHFPIKMKKKKSRTFKWHLLISQNHVSSHCWKFIRYALWKSYKTKMPDWFTRVILKFAFLLIDNWFLSLTPYYQNLRQRFLFSLQMYQTLGMEHQSLNLPIQISVKTQIEYSGLNLCYTFFYSSVIKIERPEASLRLYQALMHFSEPTTIAAFLQIW